MASGKSFVPRSLKEERLHKTEIWQCLTDLDKKKRGPAIYLSLDDKIRKMCSDIQVKGLNSDEGVEILITKLKSLLPKDINQATFRAYEKFESFERPVDMNIIDFINEFEKL